MSATTYNLRWRKPSSFRESRRSHRKQFIENLSIAVPEEARYLEIETDAVDLIAAIDELAAARTSRVDTRNGREAHELRSVVEGLVTAVLGLSTADLTAVNAVLIPS